MHPLRISCFAILLRQHLSLHQDEAKAQNGKLLPSLEKALHNLGNDFRVQIPWPKLDTPEVENGKRIHLQITLPVVSSSNSKETVLITVSGILAKSHSADLPPALMPSAIHIQNLERIRLSTPQPSHIFDALKEPESLICRLVPPVSASPSLRVAHKPLPSVSPLRVGRLKVTSRVA